MTWLRRASVALSLLGAILTGGGCDGGGTDSNTNFVQDGSAPRAEASVADASVGGAGGSFDSGRARVDAGADASVPSGNGGGGGTATLDAAAGGSDSGGVGQCVLDGYCVPGEDLSGTCGDCIRGFGMNGAPPPVDPPGQIATLGSGDVRTRIAVDDTAIYLGTPFGEVYRFDLTSTQVTRLATGFGAIVELAVGPTAVLFVAPPPDGGPATVHVVMKPSGAVEDTPIAAGSPLLVDDHEFYFGQGSALTEQTDLRGQGGSRGVGAPMDTSGIAYALTPNGVFELTNAGSGTTLYRADRASAVTGATAVTSASCSNCGGLASKGNAVFITNGELVLWDDAAQTPTTLGALPASGPVATDGVTVYYASGTSIAYRAADPLIAPPGVQELVAETPRQLWVSKDFLLWTGDLSRGMELRARRK